MESFLVNYLINFFDLFIFRYYLEVFVSKRKTDTVTSYLILAIEAFFWALANQMLNPIINLLTLFIILLLYTIQYQCSFISRMIAVVVYLGAGIVAEAIGVIMLRLISYQADSGEWYKYYFIGVLAAMIRANIILLFCRIKRDKVISVSRFPKGIINVLIGIPVLGILNCCFVVIIMLRNSDKTSLLLSMSIIIAITLCNYFLLYIVERFTYLMNKEYENEMYVKELKYKEDYYQEVEEANQYVLKLKHDLKNRLNALYDLVLTGEKAAVLEELNRTNKEIELVESRIYSDNPAANSVMKIKIGKAKEKGIEMDIQIQIPKKISLDYGDIGVLYGNLLDNAIEACVRSEIEKPFIRLKSRYQEGKLLLLINNSKDLVQNKDLTTTKENKRNHGKGILSVRKVVEKYNGTITFTDKGDEFEVCAILYRVQMLD